MMAFPSMLVDAATKAGMKIPPDPDNFKPEEFPHFHVYCNVQLGRAITWGNHWNNAEIITKVPEEKLKTITEADLEKLGFDP